MIETSLQKNALEFPTNNKDKIHVHCVTDPFMGSVVNFTIYKGDNDFTGKNDRERMEMKGREDGKKGTSFINYDLTKLTKLDPKMKNTFNEFFHIFQIKTSGSAELTKFPLVTLSLSEKNNFYLHPNYLNKNGDKSYKLLDLQDVKGKWIQVFVEAVFKRKEDGGYIRVMLKDENGDELISEMKIPHEVSWPSIIVLLVTG